MKNKKPTQIDGGNECSVYDLHNGRVFKEYGYLDNKALDKIYKLAKKAAKIGLGPTVFYQRRCGYVTEKVKTVKRVSKQQFKDFLEEVHKNLGYHFDSDITLYDESPYLRNLGRKNKKLVLIDFGPISTS